MTDSLHLFPPCPLEQSSFLPASDAMRVVRELGNGLNASVLTARHLIIGQPLNLRLTVAKGAEGALLNIQESVFHFQRVIDQEPPNQGFPFL